MTARKRVEEIDIIKAIGIICVVLGHADFPGTRFVFLFHMAIFFMASGYFFNTKSSDSIQEGVLPFIWKRIKHLWLPCFLWQTFLILMNNVFLRLNIYTSNEALFDYVAGSPIMTLSKMEYPLSFGETLYKIVKAMFFSTTRLGGAFWFVGSLFIVSIAFCLLDYLVKKKISQDTLLTQLILSLLALCVGYICFLKGREVRGLARASSYYILYYLGILFRQKLQGWIFRKKHSYWIVGLLSLGMLIIANSLYPGGLSIDLRLNRYNNPIYLLVCSISGWLLLYSIAHYITLLPIKDFFITIGKRSLVIMAMHSLCFKLVILVIIAVYDLPAFCLAAVPHIYGERGLWWLAYAVVGISVPMLLKAAYDAVLSRIKEKRLARSSA